MLGFGDISGTHLILSLNKSTGLIYCICAGIAGSPISGSLVMGWKVATDEQAGTAWNHSGRNPRRDR
jgi:hypothetical protein